MAEYQGFALPDVAATGVDVAGSAVVGIDVVGVVGGEVFGARARRALVRAEVVVGSPRHLDAVATGACTRVVLTGPLDPILDQVHDHHRAGRATCVLSSGDPGFFGITRLLVQRLGRGAVRVHPAPSSVSLAFAAAGLTWDDAVVASAHGRSLDEAVDRILEAPKAAVLTSPDHRPEAVGAALLARGSGPRQVTVAARLGEDDETVTHTDLAGLAAGRFPPISVVVVAAPDLVDAGPTPAWGRHEEAYRHRAGQITKAEVRAVVLSKLSLPRTGVLWDLGAGSGSIGIEAATLAPGLRVLAVERDPRAVDQIGVNAAGAGVDIEVIKGVAPEVLAGLPGPDRVVVGGGGLDVIEAAWQRLPAGGVAVATFVVLDRALAAHRLLGQMVQLHVDRAVPVGSVGIRFEPLNPVFICWGTKP